MVRKRDSSFCLDPVLYLFSAPDYPGSESSRSGSPLETCTDSVRGGVVSLGTDAHGHECVHPVFRTEGGRNPPNMEVPSVTETGVEGEPAVGTNY